jgi:hypothetical protein
LNTPVRLLYAIGPSAESDVRCIFELKVFQSVLERAPIDDDEASARERVCPDRESQFAVPRVTASWASHASAAI